MKTEAHRLKTDRAPGSRDRSSVKAQGIKHDRAAVMPSDLPAPEAMPEKLKRKKRKTKTLAD